MRKLSPEEAELWGRVAATIRPLSREPLNLPRPGEGDQPQPKPVEGGGAPALRRVVVRPPAPRPSRAIPIETRTLDGSWDKRLSSGSAEPDRVLDLHGMNLDSAWRAIDRALEQALANGDRILLLVTGHHRAGDPPVERGKIRAAVHDWLAASRHASKIAAVRGAHRRHGGGGSLYIVLRRRAS